MWRKRKCSQGISSWDTRRTGSSSPVWSISVPCWVPQRSEVLSSLLLDKWLPKLAPLQKTNCHYLRGRGQRGSERVHALSTGPTAAAENTRLFTPQPKRTSQSFPWLPEDSVAIYLPLLHISARWHCGSSYRSDCAA